MTDALTGEVALDVEVGAGGRDHTHPHPTEPDPTRTALVRPLQTGSVEVVVDGWRFEFIVEDAARADLRTRATRLRDATGRHGPTEVRAIIPGRVASMAVTPGDQVEAGQRLLSVEAMKMENEVRSPRAGTVERVAVAVGGTVELGDVLVVIG